MWHNICMQFIKIKYRGIEQDCVFDDDFDIFLYKISVIKQGNYKLRLYDRVNKTYIHRLITNCPKGMSVDHIDGNPLNNQKNNLRVCTLKSNCYNSRKKGKNNTSIYKGVHFDGGGKLRKPWKAVIKIDYIGYNLGRFATQEEAARAYDNRAHEVWGEFANLNFPKG